MQVILKKVGDQIGYESNGRFISLQNGQKAATEGPAGCLIVIKEGQMFYQVTDRQIPKSDMLFIRLKNGSLKVHLEPDD